MSYKNSAKNRKLKRKIINILWLIKFKWLSVNSAQKTILLWLIVVIVSLFLNWTEWWFNYNSFNKAFWITWYIIMIASLIVIVLISSNNKKETIKNTIWLWIKDSVFIIFLNIISFILMINSFFIISNLNAFASNIVSPWNGIIIGLTWIIMSITWSVINIKQKSKIIIKTDFEEKEDIIDEIKTNKNNMKLPF